MEGNPVWSNPNYANQLVVSLPSLVKLDQQDVTQVTLNPNPRGGGYPVWSNPKYAISSKAIDKQEMLFR
jgi:hypothetical protein